MNREGIAQALDGMNIRDAISPFIQETAKKSKCLIIHGASDDLMEMYGLWREELSCWEGADFGFVEALWCEEEGISWTYESIFEHSTFRILEDGEVYCRGIVIDFSPMFQEEREAFSE